MYPLQVHDTFTRAMYTSIIPAPANATELEELVKVLVSNPKERNDLARIQNKYLKEEYSFDGLSAKRTQALLREDLTSFQQTQ